MERDTLKRSPEQVSAVVGYAGGRQAGPGGRICYYYGPGDRLLCLSAAQQAAAVMQPGCRVCLHRSGSPWGGLLAMQATQCTRSWGTRR